MADKTITNPAGAFGYTDLQTALFSIEAPFLASTAVTAKSVVALGTAGAVSIAATDGVAALKIGIAAQAIAAGNTGGVIVFGIAEDVPIAGAVATGDLLKASATTAGRLSTTATPAAGEVIGVAISTGTANTTVDVWVIPSKVTS
jgi:hypothetical protein